MEKEAEEPKRLEPLAETKRHLYLLSGNECAFPGCTRRLINERGDWVGEHVHIRGVKGERFDETMTNEDRRHRDNLLLMCHDHHVETNDETVWTVRRLTETKLQHEARFHRALESYELRELPDGLIDLTRGQTYRKAANLRRFAEVLNMDFTNEELAPMLEEVNQLGTRLAGLTPRARSVLGVIIDRGDETRGDFTAPFEIPWPELRDLLGVSDLELTELMGSLDRHGFANSYIDEFEAPYPICVTNPEMASGWTFWKDLRVFCSRVDGGGLVADFLTVLDFSVLDSSGD